MKFYLEIVLNGILSFFITIGTFIIDYIWQFPQWVLSIILIKIYNGEKTFSISDVDYYISKTLPGGISLGKNIILNKNKEKSRKTKWHEFGHSKQSKILGWLYLIIIGLPSYVMAQRYLKGKISLKKYYNFYTEKWADKLGGIKR